MKNIIKTVSLLIIIALLIVLCALTLKLNRANQQEVNTPVIITPAPAKKIQPPKAPVRKPAVKKPVTRDLNDMPKSDYKVPEIG